MDAAPSLARPAAEYGVHHPAPGDHKKNNDGRREQVDLHAMSIVIVVLRWDFILSQVLDWGRALRAVTSGGQSTSRPGGVSWTKADDRCITIDRRL